MRGLYNKTLSELVGSQYTDTSCSNAEVWRRILVHHFSEKEGIEVSRIGNRLRITKEKEIFILSGDNLITRRKMFRNNSITDGNNQNDCNPWSYIMLPAGRINTLRANLAQYSDNPFFFLRVIDEMYKNRYEKNNKDALEEILYDEHLIPYWELFGSFETYAKAWGLTCFKDFSDLKYTTTSLLDNEWNKYDEKLKDFSTERNKEFDDIIKLLNNNTSESC